MKESENQLTPEEIAEYRKWKQYQAEGRLIINPCPRGNCQCTASYNETVLTGLSNNCEPYIKAGPIVSNND